MERIIKTAINDLDRSVEFVRQVFIDSEGKQEGDLVASLVKEIREKKFYEPNLDLIMVDETNQILGYVMFSKFSLQGKHEDELLLLSPVAVKTSMQRQHISKNLIEYGFIKAKQLGYKAVLVEGNPQNYRSRGFVTSANFNIVADEKIKLPHVDCLMVKELEEGSLDNISGIVNYDYYDTLR